MVNGTKYLRFELRNFRDVQLINIRLLSESACLLLVFLLFALGVYILLPVLSLLSLHIDVHALRHEYNGM